MRTRWRLGVDVGIASVGAVSVLLDDSGEQVSFGPWRAVRIFDEPVVPEKGRPKPRRAIRRELRQQRRQTERRAMRLRSLARLAGLIGLDSRSLPPDSGANLPRLRAAAARERIDLADFFRVLMRLAKKRGYYGAFRGRNGGGDSGAERGAETDESREVAGGAQALERIMAERAKALGFNRITLGEYLYDRLNRGLPSRLKIAEGWQAGIAERRRGSSKDEDQERGNLYALNGLVVEEFERIWDTQAAHHLVLRGFAPDGRQIREVFREAIFAKRPLRSPAGSVGRCLLEPTLPRAPRAQPSYQVFRIEKTIADLRWGMGRRAAPLTQAQKETLRRILSEKATVSFSAIYEALEAAGCPRPAGRGLNLSRGGREELRGDTTRAAFRRLELEQEWLALESAVQVQVINFLADLGSPEEIAFEDWQSRIGRRLSPASAQFIDRMRASPRFDRLSKMGFEGGRASYSIKALTRLTAWLRDPHWREGTPAADRRLDEEAAISQCYGDGGKSARTLPVLPPHPSTGSDSVDVALREFRRVVNEGIAAMGGPPAEAIVELSRDMALGVMRRGEIIDAIKANEKDRKRARAEIERNAGALATPSAIDRYLLAEEQGFKCPYCQDRRSLELGEVLDGSTTNIEHILPRSLTGVRRRKSELVLAHRACNDAKGDRTPWEAWGDGRDESRWTAVEAMAARMEKAAASERNPGLRARLRRKAKLLRLRDQEREVLTDESIADFADRQLHATSWIAKLTAQWLRSICPDVFVARGEMTAWLRSAWGLNTVVPEVRFEEGYPVRDTDGKTITREDFDRYRPIWEGRPAEIAERTARQIDKRIDHRHHLVDACVVALSTRRVFIRMAEHYKQASEAARGGTRMRLWKAPEPPLPNLRQRVLDLVREPNLSRKPDRWPTRALFQATAYRKAFDERGRPRRAVRTLLKTLPGQSSSVDKARRAIEDIASPVTRAVVLKAFDERIGRGMKVKEAFAESFCIERADGKGGFARVPIIRVRVFQRSGRGFAGHEGLYPVEHRQKAQARTHSKFLSHDGYAFLVRPKFGGSHEQVESVRPAFARAARFRGPRTERLYRGDTVVDPTNGRRYVIHQILDEGKLRLAPIFDARSWIEIGSEGDARTVSSKDVMRLKLVEKQ